MRVARFLSSRFVLLGVALLLIATFVFLYAGRVPANPRKYLTPDRAAELKAVADKILGTEGLKTLSVNYDKTTFRWEQRFNGQPSTRFKAELVPILKANKLHAMRVDKEECSVTYGQFFFRQWHEYIYAPSGQLSPNRRYRVAEHLTNGWYFGAW